MGKFLLGLALLAVLFALCLGISAYAKTAGAPIAETLEEAARLSLSGDFAGGVALARQAYEQWEAGWHSVAAFSDHSPMDDIDGLFAQLKAYAQAGFKEDFAALCKRISQLINAIGEAQQPSWWNVF